MSPETPKNEPTTEELIKRLNDLNGDRTKSYSEQIVSLYRLGFAMSSRLSELQVKLSTKESMLDIELAINKSLQSQLTQANAQIEDLTHKLNGNAVNTELVAEIERLKNE